MTEAEFQRERNQMNAETIGAVIDKLFLRLLPISNHNTFSRASTLVDLKLDAHQMSELQASLTQEFGIDLHPTFFFQNRTPEAIIHFFIEKKLRVFKDRLYEVEWIPGALPQVQSLPFEGKWILFGNESDSLLQHVKRLLTEELQVCITINPEKSEDDIKTFLSSFELNKIHGAIYFCGKEEIKQEPHFKDLASGFEFLSDGLIALVRGITALQLPGSLKFWVVSQSYILDGNVASLLEWPLSSLCRVINEEYPQLDCCFISLDPEGSDAERGDALYAEISSNSIEQKVSWRQGKRLVARLIRSGIKEVRFPKFSSDASYVIVGGHRPLGTLIAWWYIYHGAKNIILIDQIESDEHIQGDINRLKTLGAKIAEFVIPFDDESAFKDVFKKVEKEFPRISGIFHIAGIVDNELIADISWERMKLIYDLKVGAAWNLHLASEKLDLDHFVLSSSFVSYFAPLGKASHAVGNAFLDVLSFYRKRKGLPSLTIDWGPWNPRDTVVRKMIDNTLTNRMDYMGIEECFNALENIFYVDKPRIIDAMIKWPAVLSHLRKENPFYDEIARDLGVKRNPLLQQWLHTPSRERYKLVEGFVCDHIRRMINLPRTHHLNTDQNLIDMGFDRIEMANLKNRMQLDIEEKVTLAANFVEVFPTITKLSRALLNLLDESQKATLQKPKIY